MKKVKRRNRQGNGGDNPDGLPPNRTYTTVEKAKYTFLEPHKYLTMRYCHTQTHSVATGSVTTEVFNLNSIFDPDRTGAGHQPYGYDQIAALYNRYRVLKVKWKIEVGATNTSYYFGVIPSNGSINTVSGEATWQLAAESPFAKSAIVSLNAPTRHFKGTIALNLLNGVTMTEYLADDRFESQIGTSPAELILLNYFVFNPSGGTIGFSTLVILEYFVDLHDPILQAQSLLKAPSTQKLIKTGTETKYETMDGYAALRASYGKDTDVKRKSVKYIVNAQGVGAWYEEVDLELPPPKKE